MENETQMAKKGNPAVSKGLIWGAVVGVILGAISVGVLFNSYTTSALIGAIVITVGGFALTACMFWDCFITDFFLFFCRSFTAPFGFVFELSLDGIIWLLTVKLVLWIICGILSVCFFLLGLFLSLLLSIISFPFVLVYAVKNPAY